MIKDFNDINEIRKQGFIGFNTSGELFLNSSCIPKQKGIYLVLNHHANPSFILNGTGGFFKGKNPNVTLSYLKDNWVDNAKVVYIGKAGSSTGKATLHSRLNQYFSFGQGKKRRTLGRKIDMAACKCQKPDSMLENFARCRTERS